MDDPETDMEDDSCPCCGQLWEYCYCTPGELASPLIAPGEYPIPITDPETEW